MLSIAEICHNNVRVFNTKIFFRFCAQSFLTITRDEERRNARLFLS